MASDLRTTDGLGNTDQQPEKHRTCIQLEDDGDSSSNTEAKQPSPSCLMHIYLSQMNEKTTTVPVSVLNDPILTSTTKRWKSYYDDITNGEKLPIEVRPIKPPDSLKSRSMAANKHDIQVPNDKQEQKESECEQQQQPRIMLNQQHRVPTFYTGRGSLISKQNDQKNSVLPFDVNQNSGHATTNADDSNTNLKAVVTKQNAPKFYNGKNSWRRDGNLIVTDSQYVTVFFLYSV
jgi:hypothetical protein